MARVTVADVETVIAENPAVSAGNSDAATLSWLIDDPLAGGVVLVEKSSAELVADGFRWDFARGGLAVALEPGERLLGKVPAGAPDLALHTLQLGRVA